MTSGAPVLVWNSLIDHSLEICHVGREGPIWRFEGSAVLVEEDLPVSLSYAVQIDRATGTTTFEGEFRMGGAQIRPLFLRGDPEGAWTESGIEGHAETLSALRGACCIDLGWTPLTNTFAIWHLDLPVGGSGEITAAWVPFPKLMPQPARQRYTRLAERIYRYEQPGTDFLADLDVDDDGFVVRYGDIWEQVPVAATG